MLPSIRRRALFVPLCLLLSSCALVAARHLGPEQLGGYLEVLQERDARACVYARGGVGAGPGAIALDIVATVGQDSDTGACLDDLRPTMLRLDPAQVQIVPRASDKARPEHQAPPAQPMVPRTHEEGRL